jgi:hypothetical protein
MNAKKTPLAQVNEEHGGKAKLVDKVLGLIDTDEDRDTLKARLTKASNKKLLRLLAITGAVKEKFGSAEKLASAVADRMGRAKDSDFVKRLGRYTPGRLLDMARSLAGERRRPLKVPQVAAVAAAPKAAAKKPVAKKPVAKKPAAKKPAAKKPAAKKPAAAPKKAAAKKPAKS